MSSWKLGDGDEIARGRHAISLLGGGHRYEAYLAWDDHLRSLVVAKLLRPDQVDDPQAAAALGHEARLLERLAHPLLVRSFAAQLAAERPHLVLEYVEGPRLSTLIRRFGVILEQALPLTLNLCAVAHYLAGEGVVHLDIKPRNIIMAGAPRLIDLSVARTTAELAAIDSPVGTDAYMAPEQCDPILFGEIGPGSDIWGLGVTAVEALSGRLPYPWPHERDRFPQLVYVPRIPDGVPGALRGPLGACLERRPGDRPTAAELGNALEPLVERLPAPRIGRFRPGASQLMERLEAS